MSIEIDTENKSDEELMQGLMKGYKNSTSLKLLKKLEKKQIEETGTVKRLLNLTGPKTEEGRIKSQANLKRGGNTKKVIDNSSPRFDATNPMNSFFLNEQEENFYNTRKQAYIKDYSLNESIDSTLLDQILQEEIVLNRLQALQNDYFRYWSLPEKERPKAPPKDHSDAINDARKRFKDATNLLAAGKKDRKQHSENVGNDLASLAMKYSQRGLLDDNEVDEDLEREKEEVNEYLKNATENRLQALQELGLND